MLELSGLSRSAAPSRHAEPLDQPSTVARTATLHATILANGTTGWSPPRDSITTWRAAAAT